MKFSFFRQSELDEATVLSNSLLDVEQDDPAIWQEPVISNIQSKAQDPVRQAAYLRIGLVTVEQNTQLPAVLHDAQQSSLVQRILLPRNPRIASDELYQLDGMDYIMLLSDQEKRISKDMLRWLDRLKHLDIPMVVLLPYAVTKRREQHQVDLFSQKVGIPIVAVAGDNLDEARQQFVMTTMQFMPAMSLALAAHLPSFRDPLIQTLLQDATQDSLATDDIQSLQMNLVRQICAANGFNERQFDEQKVSMETLVKATVHLSDKLVNRLPMRDEARRARFKNAVATLFIGHASAMYLGAKPPAIRKVLLPQLWRLYRASRQPASA